MTGCHTYHLYLYLAPSIGGEQLPAEDEYVPRLIIVKKVCTTVKLGPMPHFLTGEREREREREREVY